MMHKYDWNICLKQSKLFCLSMNSKKFHTIFYVQHDELFQLSTYQFAFDIYLYLNINASKGEKLQLEMMLVLKHLS